MFKYSDYIYEIYKEKSFSKAAKNLFISQPALSATVRKLEDELNVQLFDRTTSPISLTLEGKAYIEAIEEIFSIKRNYENYIIDVSNLKVGSISISGANFISSYVLPKIIVPFSQKYPSINIELLESNSKTLVQELTDENIDLLIDYTLDENNIASYPLFDETILLCVPKHYNINTKFSKFSLNNDDILNDKHLSRDTKKIKITDFKNESFLMLKTGNSMNYHGFKICHEAGFEPKTSIYFDQLMTSYNMAVSGLGVCFVTDTLIKEVAPNDSLLYYNIDSNYAKRTVYLLHKRKRYINKVIREFMQTALDIYSK